MPRINNLRNNPVLEAIGWFAAGMVLVAYSLSSLNLLSSQTWQYQALNLLGALGLIAVAIPDKAWQPAVLNVVWAVIALVSLVNLFF